MLAVKKRPSSKRRPEGGGVAKPSSGDDRKPSSAASPPQTLSLRGHDIHFPFTPYPCQVDYMSKVLDALNRGENALLESPTGTGKTLCLLCAALGWQRGQGGVKESVEEVRNASSQCSPVLNRSGGGTKSEEAGGASQSALSSTQNGGGGAGGLRKRRSPTVIYASRTHSQLSQVVRELRSTRYRPNHAVLGSREQFCVHPKVKTGPSATAADINAGCNKLNKERKCRYRNNLEGFVADNNEGGCGDSGGSFGDQPVLDMEDLLEMGRKRKVCPFYYSRGRLETADLVLVPYNYLFDRDARTQSLADVNWKDSVLIFDEAHNLESFASESSSFDLRGVDLAGCVGEVMRAAGYLQSMGTEAVADGRPVSMDNLKRLKIPQVGGVHGEAPASAGRSLCGGVHLRDIPQGGQHFATTTFL